MVAIKYFFTSSRSTYPHFYSHRVETHTAGRVFVPSLLSRHPIPSKIIHFTFLDVFFKLFKGFVYILTVSCWMQVVVVL